MAGNSFGQLFRLTTFGESHGAGVGGVLDGMPAGLDFSIEEIQKDLDRRRPGQSSITTPRKESDTIEILSGVFEGKTLGTPIAFLFRNEDQRSHDYDALKDVFRPGHADEAWQKKFGLRDYRGGGRSSARETVARVAAGAMAKMLLAREGIRIAAYVSSVKDIEVSLPYHQLNLSLTESNAVRCPQSDVAEAMIHAIEAARDAGDSLGGTVTCVCTGMPAGLGEPVFDKLHAVLGHAILSINAVKGFELLDGFASTRWMGSENNTKASGISGGISTGNDLVFRAAFKPVSTIARAQETQNAQGEKVVLEAKGRHDPCVLPRAVVIVEAMAALVLADALLIARTQKHG